MLAEEAVHAASREAAVPRDTFDLRGAARCEAGAVTVEWVVLLASVALVSLSLVSEIEASVALLTNSINGALGRI